MFQKYFDSAAAFLGNMGIDCVITRGKRLTHSDVDELSQLLDLPIPSDLRDYLLELGDGYDFQWKHPHTGDLFNFGLSCLNDVISEHSWILEQIQGISRENEDVSLGPLRIKRWLPIIGIGEGGRTFCLDTGMNPAPLYYYDSSWISSPQARCVTIADSLRSCVKRWSRFCFSLPFRSGAYLEMTILAGQLTADFDWPPTLFDHCFDRGE